MCVSCTMYVDEGVVAQRPFFMLARLKPAKSVVWSRSSSATKRPFSLSLGSLVFE